MMKTFVFTIAFLISLVPIVQGQSAEDLARRFSHHEVYEIQAGVVMSAKFTADGLVCEMRAEQTHFNKGVLDLGAGIDLDKLSLDRLVPASERGKLEEEGVNLLTGSAMTRVDQYQNVIVESSRSIYAGKIGPNGGGNAVVVIKWRCRSCR